MSELRKPKVTSASDALSAQRKAKLAEKISQLPEFEDLELPPNLIIPPAASPTKPAVGPPGAQGLPGTSGVIAVQVKTAAQFAALSPEDQASTTVWYVIPKDP